MRKLLFTLFLFSFSFFGFLVLLHLNDSVPKAQAVEITISPTIPDENTPLITITFSGLTPDIDDFGICTRQGCIEDSGLSNVKANIREGSDENGVIVIEVCGNGVNAMKIDCDSNDFFHAKDTYRVSIFDPDNDENSLEVKAFNVGHAYPDSPTFSTDSPTPSDNLTITVCGNRYPFGKDNRNKIDLFLDGPGKSEEFEGKLIKEGGCIDPLSLGNLNTGDYKLKLRWAKEDFTLYAIGITVSEEGGQITIGKTVGLPGGNVDKIDATFDPSCDETTEGCPKEFATPIGNIGADAASFAESILNIGIGIAGGIAFILMIFGAYRLMFAGGNPEAIQQGREIITAAVAGLIVIVFAVFILSFVGFTILGLGSL